MAGELIWDNEEKTILRQVYPATMSAEDVHDIATRTYEMLTAVPHTVHLIIETSGSTRHARASFSQAAKTLDQTVAPNQGLVVVVDDSIAMQFSMKSVALTAPKATKNAYTVGTLAQARELIALKGSQKK